jgi:RecB family exonuclease
MPAPSASTPAALAPEPPAADAPATAPPAALPAALSYTSLTLLERCGYRYYLERVLRMPEALASGTSGGASGLEARARGTLVHRLLECHDYGVAGAPAAARVAEVAVELALEATAAELEEIAALLDAALSSRPAQRIATAGRRRVEHPFAFGLDEAAPLVTGVIDLLCEEPDGSVLVVDYKSDRLGPLEDTQALVARDYAVQRLIYALAALREGALIVEVVHWFLERPEEPAVARYTLAERPTLEAELAQRLRADWADPFAVSARPHRALCLTCPGRGGLCSWGERETLREDPDEQARPAQLGSPEPLSARFQGR